MISSPQKDYCLTCGQRWLVNRLEGNPHYAAPLRRVYRLSADFNFPAFIEALQRIVFIHPALRLRLIRDGNHWRQIFPNQLARTSETKIKGIWRRYNAVYVGLLLAEEGKKALDLRHEPPVKAAVFEVNKEHLLSLCVDHIAVDGLAFNLLEKALVESYQQALNGVSIFPVYSDSFLNYIVKEEKNKVYEKENLLYWKQHLQGAVLPAAPDAKAKFVKSFALYYTIDGAVFNALNDFCKKNGCFIFNVVVALHLLLLRYAGDKDEIVLSIPVSNRSNILEQAIIANLFQPLFIRFKVIPKEPILQFIHRIRDQILDAIPHVQYDHPSLSRFLLEEVKRQGGVGYAIDKACNLMVKKDSITFPNVLFSDRIDNKRGRRIFVPRASFNILAFQTNSGLSLEITWDGGAWPISPDEMAVKINLVLQEIIGVATIN